MGLLDSLRQRRSRLVGVSYRELMDRPLRVEAQGYVFRWTLPQAPEVGMKVLVPGPDGETWGEVVRVEGVSARDARGSEVRSVTRCATEEELERARRSWARQR